MNKKILAFLMAAAILCGLLPLSVSAASCAHEYGGMLWCEAAHPHEQFYFCERGCGTKYYTGGCAVKSNCATCNPTVGASCSHASTWLDNNHPHRLICRLCAAVLGTQPSPSCPQCCNHYNGYSFTEADHQYGGYHNQYFYCFNCGTTIYLGATDYLDSCTLCRPPAVSKVSLSATGPSGTIYSSGIIEATSVPASFSVTADCENCSVTSMYYYHNGRQYTSSGSSISFTANSMSDFGDITVYVQTSTGVTDSISVNFKFAKYTEAAIMWDYGDQAIIRTITCDGQVIQSGLRAAVDFNWVNQGLSPSAYDTVAALVGRYDGKTYLLTGSSIIRVYTPTTGQTLAEFDTYDQFDALCSYAYWSQGTLHAFESARTTTISYQAPKSIEGEAVWQTTTGQTLHTVTAADAAEVPYIKPNESVTVGFRASDYTPQGYIYKGMKWSCGSNVGESATQDNFSTLYNYTTEPVHVTFLYEKAPTSGSVEINVYDYDTGERIPNPTISFEGKTSSQNPVTYRGLPFKMYTASASATGYTSGSGAVTISPTAPNGVIGIQLFRNAGDLTIIVLDETTNRPIPGASITGSGSGTTDGNGRCVMRNLSFVGTHTFTASASGYYPNSGSATLSRANPTGTLTIYLKPLPKTGTITVSVYDAVTRQPIGSASVSGAGRSGVTNGTGSVTFADILYGSYTFTAAADKYYPGSGSGSISLDRQTASVAIYLQPIPTHGDITVYVKDKETGQPIRNATVIGSGRSGVTDANGCVLFATLSFGTHLFTATATEYEPGTGAASISERVTEASVTIYLEKQTIDLTNEAFCRGDIYRGSTIIVSDIVSNDGDIALTPGRAASVTMTARRNGGEVFDRQTASVIIPANGSNLVWFVVEMPADGYTSDTVTFEFIPSAPADVKENSVHNNTTAITKTVVDLPVRDCADSGFATEAPSSFRYSRYREDEAETLSWSCYEWDGGFVLRSYTASLDMNATLIPNAKAGYREQIGGVWTTRSGYGVDTSVSVGVNTRSTDIVGKLKVDTFYPEHNYADASRKTDRLELLSGSYVFRRNSTSVGGERMHGIPLWFPDGDYAVKYYAYDIWCPAGMLSSYTNAHVRIDGDMYDDLYTG